MNREHPGRLKRESALGRNIISALMLVAALVATPAQALFDDDEARRRLEILRIQFEQVQRSILSRLDGLEATGKSQALVDLLVQVEALKSEVAKLRGQIEVTTYELEQAQKRQRDFYLDLDSRLRGLETAQRPAAAPSPSTGSASPVAPLSDTASGASPPAVSRAATGPTLSSSFSSVTPIPQSAADVANEQRSYDNAGEHFRAGNYPAATTAFQNFVKAYPRSPLAPSAQYWIGNSFLRKRIFVVLSPRSGN